MARFLSEEQDFAPDEAKRAYEDFKNSIMQFKNLQARANSIIAGQGDPNDNRSAAMDKIGQNARAGIDTLMDSFQSGDITSAQFKAQLQNIVRRVALASAILGVDGAANLTSNVVESVKQQLGSQFEELDGFIEDLETRPATLRDRSRASTYSTNWAIAQTAARQFNLDQSGVSATDLEERRILGAADHCEDCVDLANDWQPFGTLPPPGQGTVCGNKCRCTMETRQKRDDDSYGGEQNGSI